MYIYKSFHFSKFMKPSKILLIILSVFAVLLIIMLIFPKEGIKITDNFTIQFTTFKEFISKKEKVDISDIIDENAVDDDTIVFEEATLLDSAMIDSVVIYFEAVPIQVDSVSQYIEFPANNKNVLQPIFSKLANIKNTNDLIRILHYGDSQIEVDRMTSYIRYKLQAAFGGTGPGFVPAVQAYNYKQPMVITNSDNCRRYTVFPKKDTIIKHNRFGIMGSFCTFLPYKSETIQQKDTSYSVLEESLFEQEVVSSSWVKFEHSSASFANVKKFNQCKMFYGYNTEDFDLTVKVDGSEISSGTFRASDYLTYETWIFNSTPQNVLFEFSGSSSPEIYGFTFDGMRGVAVDNIPIRGCSGMIFSKMDQTIMKQMYENLNVQLIILQFGGNRVPYDSTGMESFQNYFAHQIRVIQSITNNVPIIVIGPGDMSVKVKDGYETHTTLEPVRDALRNAALDNNCAFWDMYEAMGGQNSMASWVFHDPPLASKDFIHLTPKGAKIVAKMFYNAFIYEYNKYLQQ